MRFRNEKRGTSSISVQKNADQIIVMDNGQIVEIGTHSELIINKQFYHNLVKNQIDLE